MNATRFSKKALIWALFVEFWIPSTCAPKLITWSSSEAITSRSFRFYCTLLLLAWLMLWLDENTDCAIRISFAFGLGMTLSFFEAAASFGRGAPPAEEVSALFQVASFTEAVKVSTGFSCER